MATHYIFDLRARQDMDPATHTVREIAVFVHIGELLHDPIPAGDAARGRSDMLAGKASEYADEFYSHTLTWYGAIFKPSEGSLGQIIDGLDPEKIAMSGEWSVGAPPF